MGPRCDANEAGSDQPSAWLINRNFEWSVTASRFEQVYGADIEGRFDDRGLLIEHIMGVEQIEPTRMVMVGDRANDMLAATRHAIPGVGALWGYGDEVELTEAGPTVLCPSPQDLSAAVRNLLQD